MNSLKRLLREAETDHYALFRLDLHMTQGFHTFFFSRWVVIAFRLGFLFILKKITIVAKENIQRLLSFSGLTSF